MTNNTYEGLKKGVMKIKKFIAILLIIITSISVVNAEEISEAYPDVTDEIEIRYKWYKEIISQEGEYYPLKDITETDKIDINNIKYVGGNIYNPEYCNLPSEYYQKDEKYVRKYNKTYNASYVLIENVDSDSNIEIYSDNKLINFNVISNENNQIKINLRKEYFCDQLLFYVDTDEKYKISIYLDITFNRLILSKEIENEKIAVPDETWITDETEFYTYTTSVKYEESDFTKLLTEQLSCSYKEKYVYKYDVTREYYDDDYHLYVDGYIKDENDYRLFYKGEPITITNTIEVIKEKIVEVPQIVKEPQTEYVYIEKENNESINNPSQEEECSEEPIVETKTEIKTQIVEKEVFKIPKKIYIIIFLLIITITALIIKLFRKSVD